MNRKCTNESLKIVPEIVYCKIPNEPWTYFAGALLKETHKCTHTYTHAGHKSTVCGLQHWAEDREWTHPLANTFQWVKNKPNRRLCVSESCSLSKQESCLINDVTETWLKERTGSKYCWCAESWEYTHTRTHTHPCPLCLMLSILCRGHQVKQTLLFEFFLICAHNFFFYHNLKLQ